MHPTIKIAPSILSANFARLGEDVLAAERSGADRIHLDVMDGHFVPNISFGAVVVRSLRPVTHVPIEVHLMIEDPDRYLKEFAEAGANTLIVHVEAVVHLHRTLSAIRDLGQKVGVALNPATSLHVLDDILEEVDLILLMSVNPGFSGQKFIPATLSRLKRLSAMLEHRGLEREVEVDGGVDFMTGPQAVRAGANVLVAASAIFNHSHGIASAMQQLITACNGPLAKGE